MEIIEQLKKAYMDKLNSDSKKIANDLEYLNKAITPTDDEFLKDFFYQECRYTTLDLQYGDYEYFYQAGFENGTKTGTGNIVTITIKEYVFIEPNLRIKLEYIAERLFKTKSVKFIKNRFDGNNLTT